jgi:glycerate 2-kinase
VIQNSDRLTDHGNSGAREAALDIATAALEAVHPSRTVPEAVEQEGETLRVGDRSFDLAGVGDLYVVGAGKGSAAVATTLLGLLDEGVAGGVIAEKRGQARDVDGLDVLGAGHPLPDGTSLDAGRAITDTAGRAGPEDLVIACVTGGASAQCVGPAGDLSLADLRETTDLLLGAGLPVEAVNTVRKHLSEVKGGRLARRVAPADLATLVVVDEVAGEPWGPTVGDETTFADAVAVLDRHGLAESVPLAVREHLEAGEAGDVPETPRPAELAALDALEAATAVLADAVDACEAARDRAAELGYGSTVLSTSIEGESSEVARVFGAVAEETRAHGRPVEPPCVLVSGGETTVTVTGEAGSGGPNQEFGLALALEIAGTPDVTALALGTDGTDGPTDIAGALVDGSTVARMHDAAVDPRACLARHDSSAALGAVGDAVRTGPTGTNVMDLRLLLVDA